MAVPSEKPGLFATAFALPQQHPYGAADDNAGQERTPLGHLRAALDELVDAGVLPRRRRAGIEYPIWSAVHGLAVLVGQGPLRDLPDATAITSSSSPSPSSARPGMSQHAPAAQAADAEDAQGIARRGHRQPPPGRAPAAC